MSTPTDPKAKSAAALAALPSTVDAPTVAPSADGITLQPRLPATAPLTGDAIEVPGYEIEGELGRGGMGVVYLARNALMDRREVLKVMNKALLDAHPDTAERFLREIQSAARLDHENVVKAYNAMRVGDLLVFAMEYIEGEDLAKLVHRVGPLPVTHACHYISQAAMGLQHAHERGMVHRDIKPHNLILTRRDKMPLVKILDFGLAKAVRGEETVDYLTAAGAILGTPAFMAPEQAQNAATADIRTDIYSLGCTLYYLLTGGPPFREKSHYAILKAHESAAAPSLIQLRPDSPPELAAVAAKLLAKDPSQRYQKPIEVAEALAPFINPAAPPTQEKPPTAVTAHEPAPLKTPERLHELPAPENLSTGIPFREKPVVRHPQPAPSKIAQAVRAPSWIVVLGGIVAITFFLVVGIFVMVPMMTSHAPPPATGSSSASPSTSRLSPTALEPARVVAPLEAAQAQELQQAWATYLNIPVNRELDLDNGAKLKLTLIPPGAFQMGTPRGKERRFRNEGPQHRVEITPAFYMGVHAVTKKQFAAFVKAEGYKMEAETADDPETLMKPGYEQTEDDPVVQISWNDASKFCTWLSKKGQGRCELPSEAQWEYACRAGTTTAYFFGDDADRLGDFAWYADNSGEHTHPVGGKKPNSWGLYDMSGNAWQWCQDYYAPYSSDDAINPIQVAKISEDVRVIRGGSWFNIAGVCHAACRDRGAADRNNLIGMRVSFRLD